MKKRVAGVVRARTYPIMRNAVGVGIIYGWNRAHKYVENPSAEAIWESIEDSVMSEICEQFTFSEDE